jgi:hypothetical protein
VVAGGHYPSTDSVPEQGMLNVSFRRRYAKLTQLRLAEMIHLRTRELPGRSRRSPEERMNQRKLSIMTRSFVSRSIWTFKRYRPSGDIASPRKLQSGSFSNLTTSATARVAKFRKRTV